MYQAQFFGRESGRIDAPEVGRQLAYRRCSDDDRRHPRVRKNPCQGHLSERLATRGGDVVQAPRLLYLLVGHLRELEESRAFGRAAVGRDAVQILVSQQTLGERREHRDAASAVSREAEIVLGSHVSTERISTLSMGESSII